MLNPIRSNVSMLSGLGLVALLSLFCIWDRETLLMESARFPGSIELISGEFRRHSPEFHQWRIKDRIAKIELDRDHLELYDDLAVSYDKTGQSKLAIETMLEKDQLQSGLYETHANLGTFYIHAGELEKGLVQIDKAISINPDAHFGREIYQRHLVEYLIGLQDADGKISLPIVKPTDDFSSGLGHRSGYYPTGFAKFVIQKKYPKAFNDDGEVDGKQLNLFRAEMQPAIKGIQGMMRFGNFDSPVLLEAFAHLVMFQKDSARQLATRAMLKASFEVEDEGAKKMYRELAEDTLATQYGNGDNMKLSAVEAELKDEIKVGENWFAEIKKNEMDWIESGADVEAEYERVYFQDPVTAKSNRKKRNSLLTLVGFLMLGLAIFGVYVMVSKRGQSSSETMTSDNKGRSI